MAKSTCHILKLIALLLFLPLIFCQSTEYAFGVPSTVYGCPTVSALVWDTGTITFPVKNYSVHRSDNWNSQGYISDSQIKLTFCFAKTTDAEVVKVTSWLLENICVIQTVPHCYPGLLLKTVKLAPTGKATVSGTVAEGFLDNIEENGIQLHLCCKGKSKVSPTTVNVPFLTPFILPKFGTSLSETCPQIIHTSMMEEFLQISGTDGEGDISFDVCYYHSFQRNAYAAETLCPESWLYFRGYCYYFSQHLQTWHQAQNTCWQMNSTLLSIHNQDEVNFVNAQLPALEHFATVLYIGLNDLEVEGDFRWSDGSPVETSVVNWNVANNEPSDLLGKEDCVGIWTYPMYFMQWNDNWCQSVHAFACKRVAAPSQTNAAKYSNRISSSLISGSHLKYVVDESFETCFQSYPLPEQWLLLELKDEYEIHVVVLVTKRENPLMNISVSVATTPQGFENGEASLCYDSVTSEDLVTTIECVNPVKGTLLLLKKLPGIPKPFLELCDIQVYGQASGCRIPVGVSTGEIKSTQISASSYLPEYPPHLGRLGAWGSWCAEKSDLFPYFQVDLGKEYLIHAVQIQGFEENFVNSVIILAGNNVEEISLNMSTADQATQIMLDYNSQYTFKRKAYISINPTMSGNMIRVYATGYKGLACMKIEVFGCPVQNTEKCLENIGYAAVNLSNVADHGLYMLPQLRFPCPGQVMSAEFFVHSTKTFTIGFWRQGPFAENISLLSMIHINPTGTGRQNLEFHKAITVQKGDFIALSSVNKDGNLPVPFGVVNEYGVLSSELTAFTKVDLDLTEASPGTTINLKQMQPEVGELVFAINLKYTPQQPDSIPDSPEMLLISSPTVIYSPNYPQYYGQNNPKIWEINVPESKFISIDFLDFQLSQQSTYSQALDCQDNLQLLWFDENGKYLVRTGQGQEFPLVMISQRNLLLTLNPCIQTSQQSAKGFVANISFQDCAGCGIGSMETTHLCTFHCGYIASPRYPHVYDDSSEVTWTIKVTEGSFIKLWFDSMEVNSIDPSCSQDRVQVFDSSLSGDLELLDVFCNAKPPDGVMFSSWNQLVVEFFSDKRYGKSGFFAHYESLQFSIGSLENEINFESKYCPRDWVQWHDNCYTSLTLPQGVTWPDAERRCSQINHQGAHLVSIMSEEEMLVIHFLLTQIWRTDQTRIYIGLSDPDREGQNQWSDKRPLVYSAWANTTNTAVNQPDGGELEDCTLIQLANLYSINQWHDVPCALNDVKQLICKMTLDFESVSPIEIPPASDYETSYSGELFTCDNGLLIWYLLKCDGIPQCMDASDEWNCSNACGQKGFQCGDGRCIHITKYCDFVDDCDKGEDEAHCVLPECEVGEFRCDNGQCVARHKRCDLTQDCVDGSDEFNCDTCSRPSTFQCYDGQCIPWKQRCDGVKDCSGCNDEDETLCLTNPFLLCEGILDCDLHPIEGYGVFYITHSIGNGTLTTLLNSPLSLSYFGLATDDELQALMGQAYHCEQQISFYCMENYNSASWISLSGNTWEPSTATTHSCNSSKEDCELYINITNMAALPVKEFWTDYSLAICQNPNIRIGPLICNIRIGSEEVGSSMRCRNGQQVPTKYRCIYELDQYGIQYGCRDASHLQGCGALNVLPKDCTHTALGKEYRGTKSTTSNDHTCQRWDLNFPHIHPFHEAYMFGEEFSESDVHNYCRNPDNDPVGPWCYTTVQTIRYQGCGIPMCDGNETTEYEVFECPVDYIKCPGNYCIPLHYKCDGRWDCPGGEDEIECDIWECEGRYQCQGSWNCLPLSRICDGMPDCLHRDDEENCDVACLPECDCEGLAYFCNNTNSTMVPYFTDSKIRMLDLSDNKIRQIEKTQLPYPYLAWLGLSHNHLEKVVPEQFYSLPNLQYLDLSYNDIKSLPTFTFHGLKLLKVLHLAGNAQLYDLQPGAFQGLEALPVLSLRSMSITAVPDRVFIGLVSLVELDLSNNKIHTLTYFAFEGLLKLQKLELTGNDIKNVFRPTFDHVPDLIFLKSNEFKLCCLAKQVPSHQCFPPQDPISSCEDLMSTGVLRSFLWILGLMALVGNVFVIMWRIRFPSAGVTDIIINNLAVSDLCMGVYMIIIAGVDYYFKGVFIEYADEWKSSWLCKAAGFLATFSSEGSVMFLCLLTMDRFINILFPFGKLKFNKTSTRMAATFIWFIALVLSTAPLIGMAYFGDSFYGRSGVCIALPITNETPPGWEFSTFIFVGFNFTGFLIIALGYIIMYIAINQSGQRAAGGLQRRQQVALARKMMLIIMTDFVCWLPIIAMGMAALNGTTISGQVYAWVIVFVLPVNSALNPILYTMSSLNIRQRLFPKTKLQSQNTGSRYLSETSKVEVTPVSVMGLMKHCKMDVLQDYMKYSTPGPLQLLDIVHQLVEMVQTLNDMGLAHGALSIHNFTVDDLKAGIPKIYLVGLEQCGSTDADIYANDDVMAIGTIVKELLLSLRAKQATKAN